MLSFFIYFNEKLTSYFKILLKLTMQAMFVLVKKKSKTTTKTDWKIKAEFERKPFKTIKTVLPQAVQ